MSDRVTGFIVVLDKDLSEEDAKVTAEALRCFRGVIKVTPHIADIADTIAESRARNKMANEILQILQKW